MHTLQHQEDTSPTGPFCPLLSQEATQVLVQALVISRLDYCNALPAGLPANAIRQLVFNLPQFSNTTPLLCSLHWLSVDARIRFKTLVLAYRAVKGSAPSFIQALVKPYTPARAPLIPKQIPCMCTYR